jgi:CheY-like chemotaxis protein
MNAHFLIVEDDDEFASALEAMIAAMPGQALLTVAKSRAAACAFLDTQFFDFAVLDLKIPTQDGGLDADPEHGKYVFHHARNASPGIKLLVLTGSPSDDFIADLLAQKHDSDIWAEGEIISTVEFLKKIDFDKAPDLISKVKAAILSLDQIELAVERVNLETAEDRLVRIFAKRFGAKRCIVAPIGEGKSGAKPLRLQMFDGTGTPIRQSFAKLGPVAKVQDEAARHDAHVVLLDGAATPRKLAMLEYGASKTAGIFYQLADGYTESMFDVLGTDPARAAFVLSAVSQCVGQWTKGSAETRHSIAQIRSCWVRDQKAAELHADYKLNWAAEFEARAVQARWRCVHGDLHGGNILISTDNGSVLIDYGDVQYSAVSYDPVSLELKHFAFMLIDTLHV